MGKRPPRSPEGWISHPTGWENSPSGDRRVVFPTRWVGKTGPPVAGGSDFPPDGVGKRTLRCPPVPGLPDFPPRRRGSKVGRCLIFISLNARIKFGIDIIHLIFIFGRSGFQLFPFGAAIEMIFYVVYTMDYNISIQYFCLFQSDFVSSPSLLSPAGGFHFVI